jgi:ABC-type multidrug transport system ATPase subunit
VILVTHDVAEAEHVLHRVAILDEGRVAALGTPSELKAQFTPRPREILEGPTLEDVYLAVGGRAYDAEVGLL